LVIELGLPHANILVLGDFEGSAPKPTSPRDHIPPGDVVRSRFAGMPELTRRRYNERPDCWRIYYGDVRVGTVARRTGNPHDTHPWLWSCGFYPGSHLGEFQNGTASTFDDARADFESAWHAFLLKRTEADFQAWRDQRDWTEKNYAMQEAGERLPSQKPNH